MKALELAKAIDGQFVGSDKVAAELRRLAEVNAELLGALTEIRRSSGHRDTFYQHIAEMAITKVERLNSKAKEQQ